MRLLRGMLEQGEDFQTVGAEATGGAVRILSIHKSKGLEFPVVIVADCAKQFNDSDLKEPVLVHQNLASAASAATVTAVCSTTPPSALRSRCRCAAR